MGRQEGTMKLVLCALALVVLVHHLPERAEAVEEGEMVQLLDDAEVDATPLKFPMIGEGSGSGSAMPLRKKPYEQHLKHNFHGWAMEGGWTPAMEKKLQAAKLVHSVAAQYAKKKEGEKKIAELGCPCQGEKYYKYVWIATRGFRVRVWQGSEEGAWLRPIWREGLRRRP